jgi:hypothetical protein
MTGLLIGTFAFFGLHTLGWLVRAIYLYLHDTKKFREAKIQTQVDGEWFTRFSPFERFLHFLVVTSFLLLVITGMPLKFYYTDWAKVIFHVLGGPETARTLHRLGAIVTFFYFGLHLTALAGKAWQGRKSLRDPASGRFQFSRLWKALFGPDSMVPTFQDWRDLVAHNKWFFGKGPQARVRPLDVLGEIRLLRRVLGCGHHWRLRLDHVVPRVFHAVPAGLDHQCGPDPPLGRSVAGGGLHFLDSFLQHAFPHREISNGHGHLLRPRLQGRDAARAQALVRPVGGGRQTGRAPRQGRMGALEEHRAILRLLFFGLGLFLLILIIYAMATRLTH